LTAREFLGCSLLLLPALAINCNERQDARPVKTQPAELPSAPTAPAMPQDEAEPVVPETAPLLPETRPEAATKPAETRPELAQPVSTYDSKPPYPVALFVKDPSEKQPGWLRIEQLANDKQLATARGRFPEQNRIYVETGNVRRVRIHVGHLPLRPRERVVLQIDGQGMVISRDRPFTTLELSPTGQWNVVKDKD
jgi:hypothetical protein